MSANPKAAFANAVAATGLGAPSIIADGTIHRFRCKGDAADSLNGWYVLHTSGIPHGAFGSWKTGITQTWQAQDEKVSAEEQRALKELAKESQREYEAEQRKRNAKAAERAKAMMKASNPADPQHPYLVRKQIRPHGIRQQGIGLLIPIYVAGELTSVQTIQHDGSKRFLRGGAIKSGYYLIDDEPRRDKILVCEGFATGASLHEETGAACYVAFNASNLLAVSRYVRSQRPKASIVVCGDDDQWTEGNPGATKARKAAADIGGLLLMPDWTGLDLSAKPTDFNDLYELRRAAQGAVAA